MAAEGSVNLVDDWFTREQLHFAAQDGDSVRVRRSYEVAQLLVEAGADPRIPGWMQIAALDESSRREDSEGVRIHQLLIDAAAKLGS